MTAGLNCIANAAADAMTKDARDVGIAKQVALRHAIDLQPTFALSEQGIIDLAGKFAAFLAHGKLPSDAAFEFKAVEPRPEPSYPQTKMTGDYLSHVYATGDMRWNAGYQRVANAAIQDAIESGQVIIAPNPATAK